METKVVLFVDDDEIVLRSIKRGLLDEPYSKLFAKSGEEALEILQREKVHVMVTDMRMPGMNGLELLKIVKKEYPHIVSIVLSGYTHSATIMMAIHQEGIFKFIPKPWKVAEDFKPAIQRAIDHYNLQKEHKEMVEELKLRSVK